MAAEQDHYTVEAPDAGEVILMREFRRFLRAHQAQPAKLVDASDGAQVEIPPSVYKTLDVLASLLAEGASISMAPLYKEITTQQAAHLLNISRPSLVKMLDDGDIPFVKTEGGHRRLRFTDVLAYKERRSAMRQEAFAVMAAIGQKYGAYEPDSDDVLFGIDFAQIDE